MEEANLSMMRRIGASEEDVLDVQSNLAVTYDQLGRDEEALEMKRDVYSGHLKLYGAQNRHTFIPANNYATSLISLERFEEAKALLRKTMPVARRVLGPEHDLTMSMREDLSRVILDGDSSANEKRQALRTLEEVAGIMRRVMGPAHPDTLHAQSELERHREEFPTL